MELFGFELRKKQDEEEQTRKSFVETSEDDGALSVSAAGGAYATVVDLDGNAKSEADLISKYREMEQHAEVQNAIEDIINECIVISDKEAPVDIDLDDLDLSDRIKDLIREEFNGIMDMMNFSDKGYDIFNRWYVDGRIKYHVLIDEEKPNEGIQEIRYIDPRKLRKVREVEEEKDPRTGVALKSVKSEYYIFNEQGFNSKTKTQVSQGSSITGAKIAKDSIVECNSGLLNENNSLVLSNIHKAIKPLNQLRMLEDASVIYRISRAPERRVFYIDVGNLPKAKAEQYLRDIMTKYKNRLVYDASTGKVRDDRKHMTMMEDFWLPRREGGKGTQIETLPGGQNLGEMEDIYYFQKNLYKALNVPLSRLEPEAGFQIGRASEISRDEIKFARFVTRLRNRFSGLFDNLLEKQLLMKNIITPSEWKEIRNNIRYDFRQDNHFEELKQTEIFRERLSTLREMQMIEGGIGVYYSEDWAKKNVLMQTDEEIKEIKSQAEKEEKEKPKEEDEEGGGFGGPKGNFPK